MNSQEDIVAQQVKEFLCTELPKDLTPIQRQYRLEKIYYKVIQERKERIRDYGSSTAFQVELCARLYPLMKIDPRSVK